MFARTERLLLRPGWQEDAPALARAIGEEAVVRNLARAPWPYGEVEAQEFLNLPVDPDQPRFLIFARTGGAPRLVGGCGIAPSPEGPLEMGYWIARPYWGLGFATEAGRQLVRIARGGAVTCALFEEGDGDGGDAVTPMRGRIDAHDDFREEIRLMAA